jgi:hypothetical protein
MPGNVTNRSLPILTEQDPKLISLEEDFVGYDEGAVQLINETYNHNYIKNGRRLPDSSPEAPVKNRPLPIK